LDLQLYFRVVWRFRLLVLAGFVLAFVLAFLTFASVSFAGGKPSVHYRQQEVWSSTAIVRLAGSRFLEGQSFPVVDPSRFASYAFDYATLANGDEVRALIRGRGRPVGDVQAAPYIQQGIQNAPFLPLIQFVGNGDTQSHAIVMAQRGVSAFRQWLQHEQDQSGVPVSRRVVLDVLNRPQRPELTQRRKLTTPVVVFLTVMIAALGLAFILENLRPRVRPVRIRGDEADQRERQSRSA
jgi:hypothetical protein